MKTSTRSVASFIAILILTASNTMASPPPKKEVAELTKAIEDVTLMKDMLEVDIRIKQTQPCMDYYHGRSRVVREMDRLNSDTSLSNSRYDSLFSLAERDLKRYDDLYKQCFMTHWSGATRDKANVRALGIIGYDDFDKKYNALKQRHYGTRAILSFEDDLKRLADKRTGIVFKWLVEEIQEVKDFRGMNDRKHPRNTWSGWISTQADNLVLSANNYPGINNRADISGETLSDKRDGVVKGHVLNPMMGLDPGKFIELLAGDYLPEEHRHDNPYAAWTRDTENALRRKILAASVDSLYPRDVLVHALDVSGGSYPLAVMTVHAVLKSATKKGRTLIENMIVRGRVSRWELIPDLARELRRHSDIALRLRNLRPADDSSGDKLGPWYHVFGILSAGAVSSPEGAIIGAFGEHYGKISGWFEGEGGFNANKAHVDKTFAWATQSLRKFNRYSDPQVYAK